MTRKFNINNYMKGQISHQLRMFVSNGAITFEKGAKRNTCIVTVDESRIDSINLKYMYKQLLPEQREIRGA